MDSIKVCKICNETLNDFRHFWHKHKIKEAQYWTTYWPRHDKFDGSMIEFRNRDFYLDADFNSRANLKKWLDKATKEEALQFVKDFLIRRKTTKKLVYSPSQIELRSLMCPGIKWINDNLGDYFTLCKELGFQPRFSHYVLDRSKFQDISKKVIFADTREQKPLSFNVTTRHKGMSFGDYRMKGCEVYVERKALGDWWQTLAYGYERFNREIIRAKEAKAYLIVVVEEPLNSVYGYPHRPALGGRIKASPELPLHSMREMMRKHDNIQFVFVANRSEASRIIETIFAACEQCIDCDLQYAYDTGTL